MIAFFPVYPLSMKYTGKLFNAGKADVYLGGILVSWTSFVALLVALFFLAKLDLNPDQQSGPYCLPPFSRSVFSSAWFIPSPCFCC